MSSYDTYITGLDSNNKITSLGTSESAVDFKIQYTKTSERMSTPTVAVLMADTWIARWDALYTREEEVTPNSGTLEFDDYNISVYSDKAQLFDSLSDSLNQTVTTELDTHGGTLRTKAIDEIINDTPESTFDVSATAYTINDAWKDKNLVKSKMTELLYNISTMCTDCREVVKTWWKKEKSLVLAIMPAKNDTNLNLIYEAMIDGKIGVHFKNSVNTKLEEYVTQENQRRKQEAATEKENLKKEFQNQLIAEGNIDWKQEITGENRIINGSESFSSTRTTSKYKKSQEIERTSDGEKFSAIFNNEDFYESKQAILKRTAWLWEYVRENEDTAKLEDVLRYLLNIATNSNKFGIFTEEEIDNLFDAFEPKEIKIVVSYYGGTIQEKVWFSLRDAGFSEYTTAGVMGNLWGESGFRSDNMEDTYQSELGYTDETYTDAVDSGDYSRDEFINDSVGYGLAQWTWWSLKEGLYDFAQSRGVSISDEELQIEYLIGNITFRRWS